MRQTAGLPAWTARIGVFPSRRPGPGKQKAQPSWLGFLLNDPGAGYPNRTDHLMITNLDQKANFDNLEQPRAMLPEGRVTICNKISISNPHRPQAASGLTFPHLFASYCRAIAST
jgi:hypothetical protein